MVPAPAGPTPPAQTAPPLAGPEDFQEGPTTLNPALSEALAAQTAEPGEARREAIYRDIVKQEISFSRATGYDRECTAVVSLAELARREEARLEAERAGLAPEAAFPDDDDDEPTTEIHSPVLSVGQFIDVLRAAETVEEVAGVLVEVVARLVPRVLLLWERRGRLYGFASRGMGLSEVKLLTIELPKGVMQQMTACELELDSFVGPPCSEGMIPRFFELLGEVPREVLLIPAQVTPDDRWLLYADNGDAPLPALELRMLEVLAARAGARADWLLDRRSLW
ncbi:MAG TPA: hypothetical protein P5076_02875 [Myxococcota bacterium]|nr:hypothetical protein [Myxococcota bacterium]